MIDTVKLVLDKTMFFITDKSLFQRETQNASRGYFTLVQNPTKSELLSGIYKPRLTLTKRFNCSKRFEETLSIELSLPKLLYKNNFDELQNSDFPTIIELLRSKLSTMGIRVFSSILLSAPVSTIHYSKNIPLTDGTTPHYLISKIKEANISLALDVNQTDYRNDGHSYKWHSNSYEVAFYDKIKDLEAAKKSDKRAIERDSRLQLNFFEGIKERKMLEVFRMEVRLNNRQKIKQLFKTLKINKEFTFQNLFSSDIAQPILLHYLNELERQRPTLFDYRTSSSKALLADLIVNNPGIGVSQTIRLFGLINAFNTVTPRELRTMFGKYSDRSWYRLLAEAKSVKLPTKKSPFDIIRNNLSNYEPLKLVDFLPQMINNDKNKHEYN